MAYRHDDTAPRRVACQETVMGATVSRLIREMEQILLKQQGERYEHNKANRKQK